MKRLIMLAATISLYAHSGTTIELTDHTEPKKISKNRTISSSASATSGNVLWDQPMSGGNTKAYADQDFEAANDGYDIWHGDDFSNTVPWDITTIYVPGNTWNDGTDLTCAESLNFYIYANNSGAPSGYPDGGLGGSGEALWHLSISPTDSHISLSEGTGGYKTNVTLSLENPVHLSPGTYWFVFYPIMDSESCGQYGEHVSDSKNGYIAKVINPGDGFEMDATNWTDINTTYSIDQKDMAFRLEGRSENSQNDFMPAIYYLLQ